MRDVDIQHTPGADALLGLLRGLLWPLRHRVSPGGFNVLALYLQERFGWRVRHVQMAMDARIVLASFAVVDWRHALLYLCDIAEPLPATATCQLG